MKFVLITLISNKAKHDGPTNGSNLMTLSNLFPKFRSSAGKRNSSLDMILKFLIFFFKIIIPKKILYVFDFFVFLIKIM